MIASGGSYYKVMNGNIGSVIKEYDRPYISGHVTDGSSTFTFKINNNTDITVDVDNNGWFKWTQPFNQSITGLRNCFLDKTNIDNVIIFGLDNLTIINSLFQGCSNLKSAKIIPYNNLSSIVYSQNTFSGCVLLENLIIGNGFSPSATMYGFFFGVKKLNTNNIKSEWFSKASSVSRINMNGELTSIDLSLADNSLNFEYILQNNSKCINLYLPNIKSNVPFICGNTNSLLNITIKSTKSDLIFGSQSKLTKQSVLNLINAAAANVTYTLHSTVYNKCASGGEWYTDVQAAINAKALEGYTVTLISA